MHIGPPFMFGKPCFCLNMLPRIRTFLLYIYIYSKLPRFCHARLVFVWQCSILFGGFDLFCLKLYMFWRARLVFFFDKLHHVWRFRFVFYNKLNLFSRARLVFLTSSRFVRGSDLIFWQAPDFFGGFDLFFWQAPDFFVGSTCFLTSSRLFWCIRLVFLITQDFIV